MLRVLSAKPMFKVGVLFVFLYTLLCMIYWISCTRLDYWQGIAESTGNETVRFGPAELLELARSSAGAAARSTEIPFFAFIGVTSERNKALAVNVMSTWASTVDPQTVHWYGEGQFGRDLPNVIQVQDSVYLEALRIGFGYAFMTHKMQWIWAHAASNYEAKWYIRFWDDSYIFVESLRRELALLNPNEPIMVGEYRWSGQAWYMEGGNVWALNQAAMRLWAPHITSCSHIIGEERARKMVGGNTCRVGAGNISIPWCAEDLFLSVCLADIGVHMLQQRSRHAGDPRYGSPPPTKEEAANYHALSATGDGRFFRLRDKRGDSAPLHAEYYTSLHLDVYKLGYKHMDIWQQEVAAKKLKSQSNHLTRSNMTRETQLLALRLRQLSDIFSASRKGGGL